MTPKTNVSEPLDSSALEAMMIRWKLAEQYLSDDTENADTGKMALHVLVAYDVPMLVEELTRLRPELSV